MIIGPEFYREREDGVRLFRTYSDANLMIRKIQTGEIFEEAIDPEETLPDRTYEETDIPINPEDGEDEQGNG